MGNKSKRKSGVMGGGTVFMPVESYNPKTGRTETHYVRVLRPHRGWMQAQARRSRWRGLLKNLAATKNETIEVTETRVTCWERFMMWVSNLWNNFWREIFEHRTQGS